MKTTVEIPDALFRKAKSSAAQQGKSLKDFFTEAVELRLRIPVERGSPLEKPWMRAFGGLRDLHQETKKINRIIEEEFGQIDEEQWS